jgi:uncharacterized protein with HEPN domain
MIDYAQKALQFTHGKNRTDLDTNEMLSLSIVHLIEIIGEAAKNVSTGLRERHPEVPWELIYGTRNRLAHGYIDVDLDIIWTIVTKELTPLVKNLKRILKEETA